jgi:hypothetical protein
MQALEREADALVDCVDSDALIGAVVRGDASREDYVRFLAGSHAYLRWSGPLLAATAAGLQRRRRYPWLAAVVERKAGEEAPHDRWVLDDLRLCGESPELVKLAPPAAAVTAYVHFSLTMAEAGSPAFLGCAYALELLSARRARIAADNLRARAAIPHIEAAVSFLVGHGDADEAHIAALNQALLRIDDPADGEAIALAAGLFRRLYPRFFPAPQAAWRPAAPQDLQHPQDPEDRP